MRTYIYGMPSSGATFVAWTLAQNPGTIGILDMCEAIAPEASEFPPGVDVVLKESARRRATFWTAIKRFKPHKIIMVTRDKEAVATSLRRREEEAEREGVFLPRGDKSIRWMFHRFGAAMKSGLWDEVVRYEDYAQHDRNLPRGLLEIALCNHRMVPWCRENRPQRWGFGGLRVPGATDVERRLLMRVVRYFGYEVAGRSTKFSSYFARHGLHSVAAKEQETAVCQ